MATAMATAMDRQIKSARRQLKVLSGSAALKSPDGYLLQRRKSLQLLQNRLQSAGIQTIQNKGRRFVALTAKLDAMSPLKVLTRGYAMTQTDDGTVIRSVKQVALGETIHVALHDGSFTAAVTDVKEHNNESSE
jgi:exodeoxyribonuclease VII large subunit